MKTLRSQINFHPCSFKFFLLPLLILSLAACGGGGGSSSGGSTNNIGPWNGNWIQVNFLATDDNGIWDQDDLSGIGFVAKITESEWIETDDFGDGCTVTFSYSVDTNNNYSKQAESKNGQCPVNLPLGLKETGRLEFLEGDKFMIEHFDLQPGDTIAAFKWMRVE